LDEARLVILAPEHSHSSKTEESPAREFALRILDERLGGPRLNRNMLVFLAADTARREELREAARSFLAWQSIQRDQDSLNLDTVQRSQVAARTSEWSDSTAQRIREAYQWLLVPSATPREPELRWETTRVTGSDALAVRASRRLRSDEGLIVGYSGARLRKDLDDIPLWPNGHIGVRDLWGYYAQYLYLPRLRDQGVLVEAIANGVSALTWREDTFAYAQAFDEDAHRYRGLVAGGHADVVIDGSAVVVRPEVAAPQLEAEVPEAARAGERAAPDAGRPADDRAAGASGGAMTRFYGRVELDPVRFLRQMSTISDELVTHLGSAGARLHLTLELEAESQEGFPDDVQRTITENAATLKFESHEFEG
jgi:hypothetical protein